MQELELLKKSPIYPFIILSATLAAKFLIVDGIKPSSSFNIIPPFSFA